MKALIKKPAFWLFVAAIAVVVVVMYNKNKEEKDGTAKPSIAPAN